MIASDIIFICAVHFFCCLGGIIGTVFFDKWTSRSKLCLCVLLIANIMVWTSGLMLYKEISTTRILIAATIQTIICTLMVEWFMRSVFKPINKIKTCLDFLSQGDFTKQLTVLRKDELGEIAQKLDAMRQEMSVLINAIKINSVENLEKAENLNALSGQMSEKAANTSRRSDMVASSAEEMNASMRGVATSIDEASVSMENVASVIESNTAVINEIAENSEKARMVTHNAVTHARRTTEKMEALGKAAQGISKVTETINDISEQTNLLALNATIEAARAGESGRGFAVVASEIKELAGQTAAATLDIKKMIEDVQYTSSDTVTEINQITSVINDGNDIVANIAASVEEQSATTREIAMNVNQVLQRIVNINENIAQSLLVSENITGDISMVNKDAEEMTDNSTMVKMNAEELSALAGTLQEQTVKFTLISQSPVPSS